MADGLNPDDPARISHFEISEIFDIGLFPGAGSWTMGVFPCFWTDRHA
jgi:hypothetical protein